MRFQKRYCFLILVLPVFILASMACRLTIPGARPSQENTPIPVSTEALQSLEEEVQSAGEQAQETGEIDLQITEAQLTSLVAQQMKDQTDPEVQNVQVYLRDGQIQVYGDVVQNNITLPLKIIMTIELDAQGKPHTVVQEGKVGPFSLPQSMLDDLATQLDSIVYQSLDLESSNTVIESIQIADGVMTVSGRTQ